MGITVLGGQYTVNDYCEDFRDVYGYDLEQKLQTEAHKNYEFFKKQFTPLKILWIRWLSKIVKKDKSKSLKCFRGLLLKELKIARLGNYWCNRWWELATSPNNRIISLNIPGKHAREIIDRIECEEGDHKDSWFYTYRFVRDDIVKWYPDLNIEFLPSDITQDGKVYELHAKEKILPVLKEKLKELRGEIKI